MKVLIVDDNPGALKALGKFFERFGCEVVTTTDPNDALSKFQDSPSAFDLVLSDQCMPEMNGQEMLSRMREIRSELAIALVSGQPIKEAPERCTLLEKPCSGLELRELYETVKNTLAPD